MNPPSLLERLKRRRRTPVSTYRLQLHKAFGFRQAAAALSYLTRLGVTDCYTSPIFKARPGSMHGYDITDHHELNPELGSEADFENFTQALKKSGMGYLLDIVPNHMGIDPQTNPWWRDILENGPSSPYAHYFDIDWAPLKPELKNKVLLPILGDQYGAVLERGELQLVLEEGAIVLRYFKQKLPINPRQIPGLLKRNLEVLENAIKEDPNLQEFLSVLTELSNLPSITDQAPERIVERQREKEVARQRLNRLMKKSPRLLQHIQECIRIVNGQPGRAESFDELHQFLEAQAYRLAYWKTASDEINYRRFFDINQLAGLRMERKDVFEATHARLFSLLSEEKITAVRLDHPDGLYDPAAYFDMLQNGFLKAYAGPSPTPAGELAAADQDLLRRPLYLAAEKILSSGESLRKAWAIDGTTGYDFLNQINGLFVDSGQSSRMKDIYEHFIARPSDIQDMVYQSKKLIMSTSLASELNVLAYRLNQISESDRRWRDFTLERLHYALREVVACFPVYRTYVNGPVASPSDQLVITKAAAMAKRLNPATESSIFDFIRDMLIPQRLPDLNEDEYQRRLYFAMKVQQYTAPVQAKGMEDTAFYRYGVLLSLNEVGGSPERFGLSVSDFHQANQERQRDWPHSLSATATHDTKRGEDSRARINVLSELPDEWEKAADHWASLNRRHKTKVDEQLCPDGNDEYLFYQALAGAWIPDASAQETENLVSRLCDYMTKAMREAKRRTSWIRPNEEYEKAALDFVRRVLTDREEFGTAFEPFIRRLSALGLVNSLAQLVLKVASPGVPDFYQGTELWDWSLVDPDNRRPVDFGRRLQVLEELEREAPIEKLMKEWQDGKIKLFITMRTLGFRREHRSLFLKGAYVPLKVTGEKADHVIAFARENGSEKLLVAAPRLLAHCSEELNTWTSTLIECPDSWKETEGRHLLTKDRVPFVRSGSVLAASAGDLFRRLPVAWISF